MELILKPDVISKLLLVDKPKGITSFAVVKEVRRLVKRRFNLKKIKVGHAGTLDPLASGLLLICVGLETKNADNYLVKDKKYVGRMVIGAITPSCDLETEISKTFDIDHVNQELIDSCLPKFVGVIEQEPPIYSALKVNGKRLYKYAREKSEVEIPKRKVEIKDFKAELVGKNEIDFSISCAKGTYVRSLVRDLGYALNSGAYLKDLVRTEIGNYSLDNSIKMESIEKEIASWQF